VQLVSNISNLCDLDPPTSQTDGQTDGRRAIARLREEEEEEEDIYLAQTVDSDSKNRTTTEH